jgi:Na+/proline symporter
LVASRGVKNTGNYFLGGRRFGKWVMIAQSFGTGTHAEMPVSLAGIVYSSGLSGIWFQWKNLFATPFYWLLAPIYRRYRRTTVAEVVEDRYGPWMGGIYTVFALGFFGIIMASMLKGAAKIIVQATGGDVAVNTVIVVMTVLFTLYSFTGGLLATARTELVQGFLIIVLSFMLVPLGWGIVGGLDGLKASLGADKLTLTAPAGIGVWFIVMLTINGLIGIVAQPHMIAAVGTGKDELTCRVGNLYGNLVKRVCTIGWALVGLIAAAMVLKGVGGVNHLEDPEDAFGFACRHLLFPGGVGLLVACFLAANMGGCAAFTVNSGALVTQGLYRKYLKPDASDRHYLWVGRLSGALVTVAAVGYAMFLIDRVLYAFLLTETLATYFGISILGGIVWRRANRWGAIASIGAAFAVNFSLYAARGERFDSWNPWVFLGALVAGIVVLVVVSLLTPPEPAAATERYYANLQTPTDFEDEAAANDPRAVAAAGRQLLVANLLHPVRGAHGQGFFRAYRADLRGFAIGCGAVAVLVFALWLFIHL